MTGAVTDVVDVSLRIWRRALRDAVELPIATRGVALVIGEFMTSETGDSAFPAHELLQQSCGLSRSQTKHHIAVLIRLGYLRKTRAGHAGQTAEHRASVPAARWVDDALVRGDWDRTTKTLWIPWRDDDATRRGRDIGPRVVGIPATQGPGFWPPTPRSTPTSTPRENTLARGARSGALSPTEATRRRYMRMSDEEFEKALWTLQLDDWERVNMLDAMAARGATRGELVGVLIAALSKAGRLDRVDPLDPRAQRHRS